MLTAAAAVSLYRCIPERDNFVITWAKEAFNYHT